MKSVLMMRLMIWLMGPFALKISQKLFPMTIGGIISGMISTGKSTFFPYISPERSDAMTSPITNSKPYAVRDMRIVLKMDFKKPSSISIFL